MTGGRDFRLIALVAAMLAVWGGASSTAQRQAAPGASVAPPPVASQSGLVTHVVSQEGRPHTLVVTDTERRVVAVYHVNAQTGKIDLKSVRNVTWDLQMPQYETSAPTPQDVRAGLPR